MVMVIERRLDRRRRSRVTWIGEQHGRPSFERLDRSTERTSQQLRDLDVVGSSAVGLGGCLAFEHIEELAVTFARPIQAGELGECTGVVRITIEDIELGTDRLFWFP